MIARLLRLLRHGRATVVITAPEPVIRTGRVLSQGCGR